MRTIAALRGLTFLVLVSAGGIDPAWAARLAGGSERVAAGGEVEVPILIADAKGLGALHLEVEFDPAVLQFVGAAKGDAFGANSLLEAKASSDRRVVLGGVSIDGVKQDGVLARLRFKARGEAGAKTTLRLMGAEAWEIRTHHIMLVQVQAGEVIVEGGRPAWLLPALVFGGVLLLGLLVRATRRSRSPRA